MCGAGTIGAATVMVENGYVEVSEPVTSISFDTPAGLVTAQVEVTDGVVKGVTIHNVASYMVAAARTLDIPEFGSVTVDIVFGGNYYALVAASSLGLEVQPAFAEKLVMAGRAIRNSVNDTLNIPDPATGQPFHVPMVIFTEEQNSSGSYRNLVFFGESVDRSLAAREPRREWPSATIVVSRIKARSFCMRALSAPSSKAQLRIRQC